MERLHQAATLRGALVTLVRSARIGGGVARCIAVGLLLQVSAPSWAATCLMPGVQYSDAELQLNSVPYVTGKGATELGRCLLSAAAEAGNAEAQYTLALLESENPARRCELLAAAAKGGHVWAMHSIGVLMHDGQCAGDKKQALEWMHKAAAHGIAVDQFTLAIFYRDGIGVARDRDAYRRWLEASASRFYPDAQYQLGAELSAGGRFATDEVRASQMFKYASDFGHQMATLSYAMNLIDGKGVERDVDRAEQTLRELAAAGMVPAQAKLGRYLAERNDLEAMTWLCKASYQDSASAKEVLRTIEEDCVEWFMRRATNLLPESGTNRASSDL